MKKRQHEVKIKKFLKVRVHDNIKPIPDFVAQPTKQPGVPGVCNFA